MGLPNPHAETLSFDNPSLANLYGGFVRIPLGDYYISFQSDGGLIGTADDLPPETAPIGNATQFVTALNTGVITLGRLDGAPFDLLGFDLAYVGHPNSPPPPSMAFVLRGDVGGPSNVAILVDTSPTSHPFTTFNDASQLGTYSNIRTVQFGFCSYNPANNTVCGLTLGTAGQFAMDNIVVQASTVPETSTALLMAGGLFALLARRRSSAIANA